MKTGARGAAAPVVNHLELILAPNVCHRLARLNAVNFRNSTLTRPPETARGMVGFGLAWLGVELFCLSLSPCQKSFGDLASGRRPLLIPTGTQAGAGKAGAL